MKTIPRLLGYLCAALLAVQVTVVLWGVLTRYAIGQQAGWTEELARYLLVWISLLGAAYAVANKSHVAISLLPDGMEGDKKIRINRIIDALILLFAVVVMIIGGGYYVWLTFHLGQTAPSLAIPMGLVYLAVPLAGIFISYLQLNFLVHGRS